MNNRNSLQLKAYASQIYDDAIATMIATFLLLFFSSHLSPKTFDVWMSPNNIATFLSSSCAHWMSISIRSPNVCYLNPYFVVPFPVSIIPLVLIIPPNKMTFFALELYAIENVARWWTYVLLLCPSPCFYNYISK